MCVILFGRFVRSNLVSNVFLSLSLSLSLFVLFVLCLSSLFVLSSQFALGSINLQTAATFTDALFTFLLSPHVRIPPLLSPENVVLVLVLPPLPPPPPPHPPSLFSQHLVGVKLFRLFF